MQANLFETFCRSTEDVGLAWRQMRVFFLCLIGMTVWEFLPEYVSYDEVPIQWYGALFLVSFVSMIAILAKGYMFIPIWIYIVGISFERHL